MKQEKEKPTRVKGSDAVMLSLINEGVDTIFGYPGGAIMPVYDSIYTFEDRIKHYLTRHEQGAIHAAQGYARVTGKVGVCIATSGPGSTNLITGIADAMIDSTPLVCITGQVFASLLGSDAFQETDVVGISMPVTKWNYQITNPDEIAETIAKAFYIARTGRPGPVLIDIAKNAQTTETDFVYQKCDYIRSYQPYPKIEEAKIEEAADLINKAQKPYVLVGQGVILGNAEDEFKAFVDKTGIPFAWTILGASAVTHNHPLNMGMLGMHGNLGPNLKTNECDLLIAIGMRFDDRVTGDLKRYAKQAKIIHLEIDPAEINKNVKVNVPILGDVKESLPLLTQKVRTNLHHEWIAGFKKCYEKEYEVVIKKDLYPTKEGLTMAEVVRRINEKTVGEAIYVTDVGQHQMVASRYCQTQNNRSFVTSGGLGTMGFGLPAAFGAKVGAPDREVVLLVGDGGFQMTLQELGSIYQHKTAVKIVLLNNNFLGMVRQWQELFFDKRYSHTELINPDFIKLAEAFYIKARQVSTREELDLAVNEMIDSKDAYLLEVKVEKEDNVFPMVPAGASVSEVMMGING